MTDSRHPQAPDRNLALELVRATEAAALAAGRWMGRAEKESGDQAAVDAMRAVLGTVEMDGVVVIGEGEKDEAPMLFNGERVGTGNPPLVDIAVDPVEGTTLLAEGRNGAVAVISAAPRGTLFDPGPIMYMMKWVVGPEATGVIDFDAPVGDNLRAIAKAKGKDVNDLLVMTLDRPRHHDLMREVRQVGARLRLITHGDVAAALLAAVPDSRVDVLIGIGGTPEGVLTACGLRAIGGEMLGKLWPRDDEEREAAADAGCDVDEVLSTDRLCASEDTFVAVTGITDGDLLSGVSYTPGGAVTESLAMRGKSGTVRWIKASHNLDKVAEYAAVDYG
ncbi:MAG TPA: class II fructose-bisphosphatase [Egibacteraceae bacterium]|nr:class II fructose-bisphosphatase [Egibacteraceae bacterium]